MSSYERIKTMCYGVLERLDYDETDYQVLILTPDQESTKMIKKLLLDLGKSNSMKVGGCTVLGLKNKPTYRSLLIPSQCISRVKKELTSFW